MGTIEIKEKPVELKNLTPVQGDYKATVGNVGICEVKGYRFQQEDAIAVGIPSETSAAFMALSPKDRSFVAEITFETLQSQLENNLEAKCCGSCACIASGHVKNGKANVSTSYVGDSVAFLVVLTAEGKLKSVTACNPKLHDGHNEAECKAITQGIGRNQGVIVSDRLCADHLGSTLAVTRAFGDNGFFECGLLHTPETTEVSVNVASTDCAFMVVTCDGAMEYCKGRDSVTKYAEELGALFASHHQLSPESLAEKIVDHALEKGSTDNITAIVVPLEVGNPAVTVGVFDGHGGPFVSKQVSANFNNVFQHTIDNINDFKKKLNSKLSKLKSLWKNISGGNVQLKDQPTSKTFQYHKMGFGTYTVTIIKSFFYFLKPHKLLFSTSFFLIFVY